jgi:hypothetical protein
MRKDETDEVRKMVALLRADFNTARRALTRNDTAYHRRTVVMAFGVVVEGHTSALLYRVRELLPSDDKANLLSIIALTDGEEAFIRGESYRLTDRGEVTTSPVRMKKREAFLFALQMYGKVMGGWTGKFRDKVRVGTRSPQRCGCVIESLIQRP